MPEEMTQTQTETQAEAQTEAQTEAPAQTAPQTARETAPEEPKGGILDGLKQEAPDPEDTPVTDAASVDLAAVVGEALDKEVASSFGQTAQELGLTPRQMKALASWQVKMIESQREAARESGINALKQAWGNKAQANQSACLALIANVDQALEKADPKLAGAFSQALHQTGADNNVNFIRGLMAIAQVMGEDAAGGTRQGFNAPQPESAIDGLKGLFK